MRECTSCGNLIEDNQSFCPMCGTKVHIVNMVNKSENKYLKDEIAKAEAYATVVLYTKSKIIFQEVDAAEINFLNIIDKFPSEPKVYIAYVNYMTKYIDRVMNPKKGDEEVYFKDLAGVIEQNKQFLNIALKCVNDDVDGTLLQEISVLQNILEYYKLDRSIERKNQENIRKNKKNIIWGCIAVILIIIGSFRSQGRTVPHPNS